VRDEVLARRLRHSGESIITCDSRMLLVVSDDEKPPCPRSGRVSPLRALHSPLDEQRTTDAGDEEVAAEICMIPVSKRVRRTDSGDEGHPRRACGLSDDAHWKDTVAAILGIDVVSRRPRTAPRATC